MELAWDSYLDLDSRGEGRLRVSSVAQLDECRGALEIDLDAGTRTRLDRA